MLKLFIIISFTINLFASNVDLSLEYLNKIRKSAGLIELEQNKILEKASQNHANYINDIYTKTSINLMHKEDKDIYPSIYYTGKTSKDRGTYLGYQSLYYFENLSSGYKGIYASIDGLMSAIYHRYNFLKNNIDEIGIGISKSKTNYIVFNYNMANSIMNELCSGSSFNGKGNYVYNVCNDKDLKIESTLYNSTVNHLSENSPKYILWPSKDAINIPTVFFEEFPDPLPNSSISGYPISLEFNKFFYTNNDIEIQNFALYNEDNNKIRNTLLMDFYNDPHKKHNRFQFTLFPLQELLSNHIYSVKVNYTIDSKPYTIKWRFLTKKIKYPFYKIKTNNTTIKIKANTTYILSFKQINNNDIFKSWKAIYTKSIHPNITYINGNTLKIHISGKIGDKCKIKLSNNKIVDIIISHSDYAQRAVRKFLN